MAAKLVNTSPQGALESPSCEGRHPCTRATSTSQPLPEARSGPLSKGPRLVRSRAMPIGGRLGVPVLAAGGILDVLHHAGVGLIAQTQAGDLGHLITLAGMLLVLVGVIQAGLSRRR